MSGTAFHAYYFDAIEKTRPPARTELIVANSEDEAAAVARDHMGACKRVEIEHPRWEPQHTVVVLAGETPSPDPLHA
jgi:hypothetical protein